MMPAKRRSLEEFFSEKMVAPPVEERTDYVTRVEGDNVVTERPEAKMVYNTKTKNASVVNAPIEVPTDLPAKPSVKTEILKALEPEAPKPQGPYVPLNAQSSAPVQKQAATPAPVKDSSFPWDRALIGATPLLVGLMTGNELEGAQTSGKYLVDSETDLYKRERDFDGKLAEMKAKRDLAGSDGKSHYNKTEVLNPETGQVESWSTLNGGRHQFLGLVAPDGKKDKFDKTVIESEAVPGLYEQWSLKNGEKYKKIGNDFKKEDVIFKEALDPSDGQNKYKMFSKSGEDLGFVAHMPEGSKKYGMSLEEKMKLAKYNKDLKSDELKFKQEQVLNAGREGNKTTKNTREIAEAHGKIMNASFGTDPISDISTVIALFKMLDPGSVVRESELALGISAKSHEDWMNNAPELLMKQGYLTPKQRDNIRKLAQKMYNNQLSMQESSVDSNTKSRAKHYGLNTDFVAPPIKSPYKPADRPPTIKQGDHVYNLNPKTGEYE